MSKLLFVHDTPFRKINGKYYSAGGLDNPVLTRYTDIFSSMDIYCRVREENNVHSSYKEITNKFVSFYDKNIKKKDLNNLVKNSEKIIVRMPSFTGMKVLPLCRKYKKDYLIEMVACPWDQFVNHSWKGRLIAFPLFLLNRIECKKAPYVLYVTKFFLQKRYPTKGKQLACSDVYIPNAERNYLVERINKINECPEQRTFVLGTLAAVNVRFKFQETVIKAISVLKKRGYSNYKYSLAGGGDSSYLHNIAVKFNVLDQIIFEGEVKHDALDDWFNKIDIYVQPSKQEGLPRAVVEAMSFGIPCIGSDAGGIPELIDEEYVYSNRKNPELTLAEKILKISSRQELLKQAEKQFIKAKDFNIEKLDNIRNAFLKEFRDN